MFRRLPDAEMTRVPGVPVEIDDVPFVARAGDSVAAALFAAGRNACHSAPVSGAPRGPFCMMGVCFDCLVAIDGRANQQGCMIAVAPGMKIDTGRGARDVKLAGAR
jgi:predicted molibdopterin-dependent oxidoreductase YjgC